MLKEERCLLLEAEITPLWQINRKIETINISKFKFRSSKSRQISDFNHSTNGKEKTGKRCKNVFVPMKKEKACVCSRKELFAWLFVF
jgi:hypothetical protein